MIYSITSGMENKELVWCKLGLLQMVCKLFSILFLIIFFLRFELSGVSWFINNIKELLFFFPQDPSDLVDIEVVEEVVRNAICLATTEFNLTKWITGQSQNIPRVCGGSPASSPVSPKPRSEEVFKPIEAKQTQSSVSFLLLSYFWPVNRPVIIHWSLHPSSQLD